VLAFEAALGGVVLAAADSGEEPGFVLGLDTHGVHPPRDAYDEWLAPELQRRMVQIAFGGWARSTFWLDRRGWVHEIEPLAPLRPCARDLDGFLQQLVEGPVERPHLGRVAVWPLTADDADGLLGVVAACPLGPDMVRWPEDALDVLEEHDWLRAAARLDGKPWVVLSAPTLPMMGEPLSALCECSPALEVALLDGAPAPPHEVTLVEECVRREVLLRNGTRRWTSIGRQADGTWALVYQVDSARM
jgi:hypothetical protein